MLQTWQSIPELLNREGFYLVHNVHLIGLQNCKDPHDLVKKIKKKIKIKGTSSKSNLKLDISLCWANNLAKRCFFCIHTIFTFPILSFFPRIFQLNPSHLSSQVHPSIGSKAIRHTKTWHLIKNTGRRGMQGRYSKLWDFLIFPFPQWHTCVVNILLNIIAHPWSPNLFVCNYYYILWIWATWISNFTSPNAKMTMF